MNNEYFLYVISDFKCAIEIEENADGYRWVWTGSDGATRFSAKRFNSRSECKEAAIKIVGSFYDYVRSITDNLNRSS